MSDARSTEAVDCTKRVGVAIPGDPSDPKVWSGIPVGVMRGLAAAGAEPVAIRAEPSSALVRSGTFHLISAAYLRPGRDPRAVVKRARAAAGASSALASVQSRAAPRALRRAGDLDGVVQIGTGYRLATDIPVVTYLDMTVPQIKAFGYAGWQLLSRRGFDARIATAGHACKQAVACCVTSPWAGRVGDP